jgi:hypothetical protein
MGYLEGVQKNPGGQPMENRSIAAAALALTLSLPALGACDSEDVKDVKEGVNDLEQQVEEGASNLEEGAKEVEEEIDEADSDGQDDN